MWGVVNDACDVTSMFPYTLPNDLTGSDDNPLDPKLAALTANDGPTQTHALLPGSPAIDKASSLYGTIFQCAASDQRLYVRPRDGDGNGSKLCDIGAFETNSIPAPS